MDRTQRTLVVSQFLHAAAARGAALTNADLARCRFSGTAVLKTDRGTAVAGAPVLPDTTDTLGAVIAANKGAVAALLAAIPPTPEMHATAVDVLEYIAWVACMMGCPDMHLDARAEADRMVASVVDTFDKVAPLPVSGVC